LLIASALIYKYILQLYVWSYLNPTIPNPYTSAKIFLAETSWRALYFVLLGFGYWLALNAIANERKQTKLEEQRRLDEHQLREMEKILMEAEMAFLKAQINPHFLFNALNFFYSQVYPHSENTAKGILLLSDIMRYALKEEDVSGKVMLEKEVQHVQNFIAINQLRFNHKLQIQFEVVGSLHFRMILPLILITFVENCFKHGELFECNNPLQIRLEITNDQLFFYTRNKKRTGPKERHSGIGLVNTKKRLDLMYNNRYSLNVTDEPEFYTCSLTITL
jgi:LytS/YehU family sensor histidine kinase